MKRKGFSLVEVLIAIAIGGSSLVLVLGLSNHSVKGARSDTDRFAQDQMTAQVAELLAGESLRNLRQVAAGGSPAIAQVLTRRLRRLPKDARAAVQGASQELMKTLACSVEEDVGGHHGLTRITVSRGVNGSGPRIVRLVRLHGWDGAQGGTTGV